MICILILLICIFVEVNSYTAIMTAPNVGGKCQIKGNLIESGKSYYNEEKCEEWICEATSDPISYEVFENGKNKATYEKEARVSVLGCGVAIVNENGKDCRMTSTKGKYPDCCQGPIVCP